jgi:hypothetical protein
VATATRLFIRICIDFRGPRFRFFDCSSRGLDVGSGLRDLFHHVVEVDARSLAPSLQLCLHICQFSLFGI